MNFVSKNNNTTNNNKQCERWRATVPLVQQQPNGFPSNDEKPARNNYIFGGKKLMKIFLEEVNLS